MLLCHVEPENYQFYLERSLIIRVGGHLLRANPNPGANSIGHKLLQRVCVYWRNRWLFRTLRYLRKRQRMQPFDPKSISLIVRFTGRTTTDYEIYDLLKVLTMCEIFWFYSGFEISH